MGVAAAWLAVAAVASLLCGTALAQTAAAPTTPEQRMKLAQHAIGINMAFYEACPAPPTPPALCQGSRSHPLLLPIFVSTARLTLCSAVRCTRKHLGATPPELIDKSPGVTATAWVSHGG